ncbi:hypothetical protein C7974DRAFT_186315 [Boeremia exigua]|uniref:uncharacterized protein n=1 Tax=Boeremia exigua TaxID=749465 RepID=UPI001E8D89D1|nr:uncharacterized protein C7974DRAFT_186315 [Boeremia exigua]KAH6629438.1 hypothetical protein C7974DRAFT_186315 [Boeremia exigua]
MTYGKSNILPPALYRTFYELSATLSSRVSKDTHVRHRENENLILRDGNAFQTVGNPTFSEKVTKEGIERHLVWNKKKDPSAWISMFDELSHAKRRALFHYDESQRIGQRVTIAQISTADLIPATVHATCRSVWEIVIKDKHYGKRLLYSVTTRQVDIPIWVHSSVRPTTTSSISSEQLIASHADLFVCIKELRKSNLVQGPKTHSRRRTIAADGHNYEWLALGRILESRVTKVFPFDGKVFHMVKPSHTVRSTAAKENWIFDFDLETWRLESELDRSDAHKRKRDVGDDDDDHETTVDNSRERKKSRGHNLGFSAVIEVFAST